MFLFHLQLYHDIIKWWGSLGKRNINIVHWNIIGIWGKMNYHSEKSREFWIWGVPSDHPKIVSGKIRGTMGEPWDTNGFGISSLFGNPRYVSISLNYGGHKKTAESPSKNPGGDLSAFRPELRDWLGTSYVRTTLLLWTTLPIYEGWVIASRNGLRFCAPQIGLLMLKTSTNKICQDHPKRLKNWDGSCSKCCCSCRCSSACSCNCCWRASVLPLWFLCTLW